METQSPFSKTKKPSRMKEECLGYNLERKSMKNNIQILTKCKKILTKSVKLSGNTIADRLVCMQHYCRASETSLGASEQVNIHQTTDELYQVNIKNVISDCDNVPRLLYFHNLSPFYSSSGAPRC